MQNNKDIVVKLIDVVKNYGTNRVVKKINLDISEGEFLTLLGPSGCGKTTTLRMIAGFEAVTEGEILLHGENVADKQPNQRDVNTVFQNYALFPHMNIEDNIAFGLVEKRVPKAEIKQRVEEMLTLVRLEGMGKRMPSQLSGGQKQRIAIARALVNRPRVLLLDEPLGALDLKLRKQMQTELKHIQQQIGITFVYVTHDQEEALTMSDRIAVMNNGIIEQIDTPQEIYNRPATKFVADFIGESNILEGYTETIEDGSMRVLFEAGKALISSDAVGDDQMISVCVRPENLHLSTQPVKGFSINGVVREHIFIGSAIKTIVELVNGHRLVTQHNPEEETYPVDTRVHVYWQPERAVVVRNNSEDTVYDVIEVNPKKAIIESLKKEG